MLEKFSDQGFKAAAFPLVGNPGCDVVLTISAKGKASDPVVTACDKPILEKSAVDSLLKSHYKPGMVNGKAVAVRASVRLEFGGFPATK
jgi:hypothetical protein